MARERLTLLLVVSLLVVPFIVFKQTKAEAAALTSVRDLISDSRPSTVANHTIQFISTTAITQGQTIVIKPDDAGNSFNLGSVAFGDIDVAEDTDGTPTSCSGTLTDETLGAAQGATTWGVDVNTSTDEITFTAPSDAATYIAAGACVVIEIGTHAAGGTNQITNPGTQGTKDITITNTSDSGKALIAIIDTITASVTVDSTLTVTVAGQTYAGNCPTIANSDTQINTTATSIPFGTAVTNSFIDGCQQLTVSTNGAGGYTGTVIMNDQLSNGATEIANGNCDGGCSDTTDAAWATDTNNGFAYCLINVTGTDMDTDFTGNDCDDGTPNFKTVPDMEAVDTPEQIMLNAGPVSANSIRVAYRLSVAGTQAAGTYTNNIIYVVTPTY